MSLFDGFLKRGILFFVKVFRDEFFTSNDANEVIARFRKGGNIIGKKIGVFIVADNDCAETTTRREEERFTDGAEEIPS